MTNKFLFWSAYSVVTGVVLFVGALVVLGANEMSTASKRVPLSQIRSEVVEHEDPVPDPGLNGRLVWTAANFVASDRISDEIVNDLNVLILFRRAWMFQWVENEQVDGTVAYARNWVNEPVSSSAFRIRQGHENPPFTVTSRSAAAGRSRFGEYDGTRILQRVLDRVEMMVPLGFSKEMLKVPNLEITENRILMRVPGSSGTDYQVGDQILEYYGLLPGDFSIIARQVMDHGPPVSYSFDLHTLPNGKPVFILYPGRFHALQMLEVSDERYKKLSYTLRSIGAVLMWGAMLSLAFPIRQEIRLPKIGAVRDWKMLAFVTLILSLALDVFVVAGINLVFDPGDRGFFSQQGGPLSGPSGFGNALPRSRPDTPSEG